MTRSRIAAIAAGVLLVGLFSLTVSARDRETNLRARLLGFNEVPAVSTTGHARLHALISPDETTIDFTLTYEDLSGPPAAAHVHFGRARTNGGVSFFFCGGGGKPACPTTTSGTITGTVVAADVVGPAAQGIDAGNLAAIIEAIRAGAAYANMHSAKFPSGEIRGQISASDRDRHDDDDE